MKTTKTAQRTTGVLLAIGVLAATLVGLAPAASAAEYGSLKITDKQWYLQGVSGVLHVDEDHDTSSGFYFAMKQPPLEAGARDYKWVYQPYGAHCTNRARYVGMNPWTGTYTCLPDYDVLEAGLPGYTAARDNCRASTGKGYMEAATVYDTNGNRAGWTCDDWVVDENRNGAQAKASSSSTCAPWESTGYRNGVPECVYTRYAWEDGGTTDPGTGDQVTASSTKTFEAAMTATQSATVTQARRVKRMVMTRKASTTFRRVYFQAFGRAPVFIKRKATRTASATVTRRASVTLTRSCSADTLAAARACADGKALDDARHQAETTAFKRANRAALNIATRKATRAAAATAVRKAKNARIPLFKKRRAANLAQKRADANLVKKVQQRFPGYRG